MEIHNKNALYGRFFILILYCLCHPQNLLYATENSNQGCHTDLGHEPLAVDYVIDGDTVKLENGQSLRLIGIDTPEIGRDGKAHETGAVDARKFLKRLMLKPGGISVVYDIEGKDRFGRLLGHLFINREINIQALILTEGYATPFTVPPNLAFIDCYQTSSRQAITDKQGLWALPQYQVIVAGKLQNHDRGYRRVFGKVTRIGQGRTSLWINLSNEFAIRIVRSDIEHFKGLDLDSLAGKYIEVKGIIYQRSKQLRMRIRHPLDLQITAAH